MQFKKALWLIIALLLHTVEAAAQEVSTYEPLAEYPFVYVSDDRDAVIPEVSDSLFNAASRGIQFAVNRTELREEEPFVALYREHIVPILRDKGLVLRKILVRGAASPEGSYENNRRLGIGRTRELVNFVVTELGISIDPATVQTGSVSEDYEYLAVLMRRAGDAQAEVVERIWRECGGDERCCKQKLQRHDGGRTWRRLLKTYFPRLRQARVMMWFGRLPIEVSGVNLDRADVRTPLLLSPDAPGNVCPAGRPALVPLTFPSAGPAPRLPLLALRTNLVHDFLFLPGKFGFAPSVNAQLEYFPRRGHLTYQLGFTFSNHRHWSSHRFFQVRDVQFELRRYFRSARPVRGAYLGAYAEGCIYGIGFGPREGWEGEGLGAGLSGGYVLPLTRDGHFRLELMVAAGGFVTRYDPYVWGNPVTGDIDGKYYYDYSGSASKFRERNHLLTWFGPTNFGISLTYDILYYKRKKGGVR